MYNGFLPFRFRDLTLLLAHEIAISPRFISTVLFTSLSIPYKDYSTQEGHSLHLYGKIFHSQSHPFLSVHPQIRGLLIFSKFCTLPPVTSACSYLVSSLRYIRVPHPTVPDSYLLLYSCIRLKVSNRLGFSMELPSLRLFSIMDASFVAVCM